MRLFTNRRFSRFAAKAGITDRQFCTAAEALIAGAFDADLGGGVYKLRIARAGGGKSSGFRTLAVLKVQEVVFYVYGFAKSDRENITLAELRELKLLARFLIDLDALQIKAQLQSRYLIEVQCHGETVP